jgi:hypothetical protein
MNKLTQCGHKYQAKLNISLDVKDYITDALSTSKEDALESILASVPDMLESELKDLVKVTVEEVNNVPFEVDDFYYETDENGESYVDCYVCEGMDPIEKYLTYEEKGHLWGIGYESRTEEEQAEVWNYYYEKYDGFKEAMDMYNEYLKEVEKGKYV